MATLVAYNGTHCVWMYAGVDNLVFIFPHGRTMYSCTYKVHKSEEIEVLAVKEFTSERDVVRCSAEWDDVVMSAIEWHSWSQGESKSYYDIPVVKGTFSHYM